MDQLNGAPPLAIPKRPRQVAGEATEIVSLLGLFSSWRPNAVGGVQVSGQVAWRGITAPSAAVQQTVLFALGDPAEHEDDSVSARTKLTAVWQALSRRWPVDSVLVWHISLLRLIPFFRLRNARVMLFLHGIEAWRKHDWLLRRTLRRVDLFLTNSDHTWTSFSAQHLEFASASHRTVNLGIDGPVVGDIARPRSPVALMLGRLESGENYKGHREMIAAWPAVLRKIPGAELRIAGEGTLRPVLEGVVRQSGLAEAVRFYGRVSEEEKQRLLAECRCLVLPSRGEGFGLVYLEAMRLGRPCLVSTLDGGREVVNPPEAGLAVNPADHDQIVESTCRLLTLGPEWQAWSAHARRRYEQHFTAAHFQRRLLDAMLSV